MEAINGMYQMKKTIDLDEYLAEINNYTLNEIKFHIDASIYHQILLPNTVNSSSTLYKSEQVVHLLISSRFILHENFWDIKDKVDFTINLIELLDYPLDKFDLFKLMYGCNYQYEFVFSRSLRNIGKFPIDQDASRNIKKYLGSISLSNTFKFIM